MSGDLPVVRLPPGRALAGRWLGVREQDGGRVAVFELTRRLRLSDRRQFDRGARIAVPMTMALAGLVKALPMRRGTMGLYRTKVILRYDGTQVVLNGRRSRLEAVASPPPTRRRRCGHCGAELVARDVGYCGAACRTAMEARRRARVTAIG